MFIFKLMMGVYGRCVSILTYTVYKTIDRVMLWGSIVSCSTSDAGRPYYCRLPVLKISKQSAVLSKSPILGLVVCCLSWCLWWRRELLLQAWLLYLGLFKTWRPLGDNVCRHTCLQLLYTRLISSYVPIFAHVFIMFCLLIASYR